MGEELSKGEEGNEDYCDYEEVGVSSCGCFRGICYSWRRGDGYVRCDQILIKEEGKEKEKKWKKEGVFSEWTRFIRQRWKMRRIKMKKKKRSMEVAQYDPESYALNFDEGTHKEDDVNAYVDYLSAPYVHGTSSHAVTVIRIGIGSHHQHITQGIPDQMLCF